MMITSQKGSFYFFSSLTSFLLLSGIFCYLYTGYTYCFISSVHLYLSICSIAFIMLFSCMSFKFPIKCRINCRTPSLLLFLVCGLLMNSLLVVAVAVEVGVSHQQGNYTYLHLSVKSPTMIAGAFLMVTSAVLCLALLIMSKFFNQSVHDKKENSYEGIALWFGFTIGSLIFHINNSYSSVSSSSSLLVLLMLFNVSLIIHFALINEKRFILIGLSVFFLFGYLYYLAIHILPDTIATNSNHLSKELVTKFCLILHMPILVTYSLFCAFHFFTFCPTLVNSIHLTHCLWDKISMRLCIFLCSFYFLFQMTFILIFISQFVWHKWLSSLMWVLCTVLWTTVRFLCFICLSRLVKVVRISCGVWHSPIAKRNGLNHVWASEGIRYLALISKAIWILAIFTTISCLILSTSVGLTSTPELLYAFQISFLMDCYLVSIFHHLSRTIGPNAIGYALIRQVSLSKSSSSLQSVSSTNSTSQLLHHQKAYYIKLTMLIENFFSHFSIHNFGCIYSSAGRTNKSVVKLVDNEDSQSISDQTLQGINNFFQESFSDSYNRYDTYLLYYSGPDNNQGDWVFEDDSTISLKDIINLWEVSCISLKVNQTNTRLLILLDTLHSEEWYKSLIKSDTQCCIALQSAISLPDTSNIRQYDSLDPFIGRFTELWINLNTKAISSRLSAKQLHQNVKLLSQRIQFVYSTTYNWCNFCLRQPSAQEIHNYWRSAFPWCFHLLCYIFITVFRYKNNNFQSSYMSNSLITTSVAMTHPWLIFGVFRQLKKIIAYVYHKIRDQYRQNYFRYASPTILETDHGFYLIRT